jgi:hypothetical protein
MSFFHLSRRPYFRDPPWAMGNGLLYCIGGQSSSNGTVLNDVQIYQP